MVGVAFALAACLGTIAPTVAAAPASLVFPQARGATHQEIRQYQTLGRVAVAPDGSFFLYEWSKPYNWAPDVEWLPAIAAKRTQAWLYRVDTTAPDVTSEYLFYPDPGSSYYLGQLSPDGKRVAFYEVDHDENRLRTGVVTLDDPVTPTLTWFDAAPDANKLHLPAVWRNNDEIVYATRDGLVRAQIPAESVEKAYVMNGEPWETLAPTKPCDDCKPTLLEDAAVRNAGAAKERIVKAAKLAADAGIPKSAEVLARSAEGDLTVYSTDTSKLLTLGFAKGAATTTLFENARTD